MKLKFFFIFAVHLLHVGLHAKGYYHAQFEQDRFVNENFFKNKRKGVFIDIGAADGISFSNSYFFEKYLNWTGICVEPVGHVFNSLKKVRKCVCIEGCIWNKTGDAEFLKITFPDGSQNGYSGLIDTYDPRQMAYVEKTFLQDAHCKFERIKVKCYKFNDICKNNKIKHVDYLSIDTEGSELDILKSIDFDNIDIDVIDVENNHNEDHIKNFLKTKGFKFIARVGVDDIYRNSKYLNK